MTDEKIIEEMAKDIYDIIPDLYFGSYDIYGSYRRMAERHYEQGYRKIPEGAVVLDQEVYKELKFAADHYDPFWFCTFGGCEGVCKECKDTCEMSIFVQARKEMAEKIWRKVRNLLKIFEVDKIYLWESVYDLAKQDGVELKEN